MPRAIETLLPPAPIRKAAPIAPSGNCSAIAGMNHSRYWPASRAVSASAAIAVAYHMRAASPTMRNDTPNVTASAWD